MRNLKEVAVTSVRHSLTLFLVILGTSLIAVPEAAAQNRGALGKPGQGPVKRQATPPDLMVGPASGVAPYQLIAANCGSEKPVLVFSVQVSNTGGSPSPAQPAPVIYGVDSSLSPQWMGSASLPGLNPGQSIAVSVPVMEYATPFVMGGNAGATHNFRFLIKGAPSYQGENQHVSVPLQLAVGIPPAFCLQRPPQPRQGKEMGAGTPLISTPNPAEAYQTGGSGNTIHPTVAAVQTASATSGAGAGKVVPAAATQTGPNQKYRAEILARLKAASSDRKAGGQIKIVPDMPAKVNHTAALAILQKQHQTAMMSGNANLSGADGVPSASALTASTSASPTTAAFAVSGSNAGKLPVQPGQTSQCQSPSILTMNGLPIPPQNPASATNPKGGGVRPLGQNGGTAVLDHGGVSAWFTNIPEYNLYAIRGCGFGQIQGAVFLAGSFPTKNFPGMNITSWSDTEIVASLYAFVTGVPDLGGVTLVVYPQNATAIQATGFNFYALREEQPMVLYPASQATVQAIQDVAGNPISAVVTPQVGQYFGGSFDPTKFISVEVDRFGSLPFPVAHDSFNFSNMQSNFYVDRYQLHYLDVSDPNNLTVCTPTGAQSSIDTAGSWATTWDPQARAVRVTTEEQHCHVTNAAINLSEDFSFSVYAITVWVVGPKGVFPWPSNLQ